MSGTDKPPSALDAPRRITGLDRLADGWRPDVLVVGAGVTGCGIALDAACRGLSVVVVDRGDLGNGTSRWSSKLVHGGLRYLAAGDVGLALESARERGVIMERVAPHLVRPLRFLTPLGPAVPATTATLAAVGYVAGDLLRRLAGTHGRTLPGPRWVSPTAARSLAPAIAVERSTGALLNTDGQLVDDARLVVTLARTAAAFGAAVLPRVSATAVARDRVELSDEMSGETLCVRAGRVVVAAGVWSDALDPRVAIRPSKGVHLVIDGAALGHPTAAVTAPLPGHRSRFVFLLPQLDGRVYLGVTDDPAVGRVPDDGPVLEAEQQQLLAAINPVLARPLTAADVLGGFAGYRPLVDPAHRSTVDTPSMTADLSRRHLVIDDDEGPLTVVGGKLTTYRRMAADVVDRLSARPCRTATQPLVGALPRRRLSTMPDPPWLVARYGAEATVLSAMIQAAPRLAEPIVPGLPYQMAEFHFAVEREGALTPEDLVDRRTRLGLVPSDRAAALDRARQILG